MGEHFERELFHAWRRLATIRNVPYVSLEERVPQDHPLRRIREMVDQILRAMAKEFDGM